MSGEYLKAVEGAKNLETMPSNENLLKLYAYSKQAELGDVKTEKLGMLDLKGRAQWESWNQLKGTSKADAESKYIELVKSLK